jgi:hypothetical protein
MTMTATTNQRVGTGVREQPAPAKPAGAARSVWWLFGGILAVATFGWGIFQVVSLIAHEEYTVVTPFPASDVESLDIAVDNGSVTVLATEGDEVTVTAEVSDGLLETDLSQEVVDGVLRLRGGCPVMAQFWCDVDFTVRIPADRPVTVDSDNGTVEVRGIDGPLDLENDNGRIELDDVSGNMELSNDNGRITGTRLASSVVNADTNNGAVELSFSAAPTSVIASSNNGSVEVGVPEVEGGYRVEMSTDNGDTDSTVLQNPESNRSIVASTDNGDLTVRYSG